MPKEEHVMFKKIKEWLSLKPKTIPEQAPYKVEAPLVKLGPEPTPAPVIEATAVVEFVPAPTVAEVATPAKKTRAPAKPKAEKASKPPKAPKAPAAKKPRTPKAK
jgi:hypothetical protein